MPRHSVIVARILWTFAAADRAEQDPEQRERWLAVGRKALRLLTGPCWDAENGGVFWNLIETHSRDAGHGGYLEVHARDWGPLADMALSERDLSVPKSMNTNLHVLEAYTNLLRVTGDERVRTALADLLRVCLDHIVVERSGRSPEPTWPDDWRRRARWARCGRRLAGLA